MIEQLELFDWHINNVISDKEKRYRSISSYYLTNWYEKIKNLTFETYIYKITTTLDNVCPNQLPFEKCMVRYENKSPKDSEFLGPITSKKELIKVFYTSLRCKTNQGEYLCIRKWQDNIDKEYRCFWNLKLVAVGAETFETGTIDIKSCHKIIDYINNIKIPYKRCVMDIAEINGAFKVIEFNSWETNSGAYPFSWTDDTEILYPDFSLNNYEIIFKQNENENKIEVKNDNPITYNKIDVNKISKILKPFKPANWVITDNFIFITTDIWLGRFTHKLKNINWKRGIYRFSKIELCHDNILKIDGEYFYDNFSKCNIKCYTLNNYENPHNLEDNTLNRYGFYCIYDGEIKFCRLSNSGKFYF